ncbi:ATP-binding protein [Paracoccus pacificus]|uniref:histidine kinase n=1 Tax=Paracoccus pacificus TaxID=1463598 RepID=A0ABW4R938_9RHOB
MKSPLPGSIRGRLLGLAALWLGVALIAAWFGIGLVLERFVERRIDGESAAMAESLIAATTGDANRLAQLGPAPSGPRYQAPLSGWYWQVQANGVPIARSESLFDSVLNAPDGDFTGGPGTGPDGAAMRVLQRTYTVPESDEVLSVLVTAPQSEIDTEIGAVQRPLAASLLILGIGLALASLVQVTAGLRSLTRLGHGIAAIRAGSADHLPPAEVTELAPVVQEVNALLDHNRQVLTRTREHVGNLAHSLKTPLSAALNSLPDGHEARPFLTRMERQIGWHLRRARSAAAPGLLGQRTRVAQVAGDILMVLGGVMRDRGVTARTDCPADLFFAGDHQDLEEMVGNLTENAVKWARTQVRISARPAKQEQLILTVEDDGPGMDPQHHARALTRGARLDETASGSGLGLAIVADLAALHGGGLSLGKSDLGGLRVDLTLPAQPAPGMARAMPRINV